MVFFSFFSYGILLAQELTKKVIERGYTPFVVIRPENDASRNLYTKLGFEKAFGTCRVTLVPHHDDKLIENNVNGDENIDSQSQKDEGIEDMRNEITEPIHQNRNNVANDEGIADDE